ncbi:MAG: ATP-binding protein [Dehalococcoidales bacterium]|nr:ATP-binding protein [Dehalococcoidales bacterium]
MKFFKSIRTRLTIWYLVVIVVLLLIFSAVAYFMLSVNLYQNLDKTLVNRAIQLRANLTIQRGEAIFTGGPDELLFVFDSSGALMQKFGLVVDSANVNEIVEQALRGENSFLTTVTVDNRAVRLHATSFMAGFNNRVVIVVGQLTSGITMVLDAFKFVLVIAGVCVVVLAGIGGLFLASRVLKPVERITRTAQEIGESDLSRRINVKSDDELGRLASTLNSMIGRLEAAFNRQRQFTADASHELRTPLAIMQAESTLSLSKERTETEYRRSLETISQESDYMASVISKLLFLARSDAGKEPVNFEDVDLKELISTLSSSVEAIASDKGIKFTVDAQDELIVNGDRVKLRQLFINILENAIRYTPGDGNISVSLIRKEGMAVVAVSDTGIGISPEHLPHIFERFYRVDKARSRADGGVGLGLAITKYIAESHGGMIEVESQEGKGSTFYISLPLKNFNTD